MTANALLCIVSFGDHLGLTALMDSASEELIQRSWLDHMPHLKQLLQLPYFIQNLERVNKLLHHAKRGAYTELQVLELLEFCELPENDFAAILSIATIQPAEVHTLLGTLTNGRHSSTGLLHKAVTQHLKLPASCPIPTMSTGTFIVNNVMMPSPDEARTSYAASPGSQLTLDVERRTSDDKDLSPAGSPTYSQRLQSNLILTSGEQTLI